MICCFANIHRILAKVEQKFFQYTDAIWSAYSVRPRAVSEDWLKPLCGFSLPIKNACSPSEGRVGRNCMRTNGIVCYMRNLLSPLQIPIYSFTKHFFSSMSTRMISTPIFTTQP